MREYENFAASNLQQIIDPFNRLVLDTEAAVGTLYVLPEGGEVLHLAVVAGASRGIVAPWMRIPLSEVTPVAEAVRGRQLVWVNTPQQMAHRYPRLRLLLPYDFMVASAPMIHDDLAWGGISLIWPTSHTPQLEQEERDKIDAFCGNAGQLLRCAAERGNSIQPGAEPAVFSPTRSSTVAHAKAMAAHDAVEYLAVGCLSLDADGRIAYINRIAAELLGTGAAELVGVRPWEKISWLTDPAFEDCHRATVVSRQSTEFVSVRPPDGKLSFQLRPGTSGVSVLISPLTDGRPTIPGLAERPATGPTGASALYQLMHLAATLTEAAGVADVVDLVANQFVPSFGAQGLALMTVEEGRLRVVGYRGYSAEFVGQFDGESLSADTPSTQVLAMGGPVFFSNYAEFQNTYPNPARYGNRDAWAFLPLIASSRLIGLLVLSYDRSRSFPEAERALLTALAGVIAQALDRARLFDVRHNLSRALQADLLPQDLAAVPGLQVAARYLPAGFGMDIGGDFYDLIRSSVACADVVIGDVQGHSVQAAALMGQVRTAIHAHAAVGAAPGEVLARTNRLLADLNPGLFTSCLYAHVDVAQKSAHFATAGHPPALIRHPGAESAILQINPGPLLGVIPDAEYPTTEVALSSGTILALYTDGLVETPGVDIGDAIVDLAHELTGAGEQSVEEIADAILNHAARTVPGTDDKALLLVRLTG
ncbi:SpoIIE family protein phosphatase [Actinacidiphila sp. bgisy160]|uniref:PP2C family protein-serine/threonine phosphatase n=1 Tax=Actinacidiphila sp. bgisy160 TaxID=3413796 RepID=UPI003D706F56